MIERASEFGASAAAPLISGDTSHQSAGDMLRQAREAHGLDVAVVAAALKVPVQKIEALEDDDIDALPDPVFARALAASMCRALRIDPKPVLSKLPDARNPGLHTQPAMSPSFHTEMQRTSSGSLGSRSLLVVVGLLLAGAAALFWLPQSTLDGLSASVDRILSRGTATESASEQASAASGTPPTASETAPAAAAVTDASPAANATASAQPSATSAGAATSPAPAGAATTAQTTPAIPSVPQASSASESTAGQTVVFNVRAESWISVTEPGGKQLVHRIVQPGETVALSGNLPLSVVVGRAAGVDVQVRGKAFDLAPIARGGSVARFEIKP